MKIGQRPVILYFGDFDPSGVQMLEATEETLRKDMVLGQLDVRRIALNMDDIERYNLPNNPDAVKKSDRCYDP